MAKTVALTADDLASPSKPRQASTAMRGRGVTPSSETVPLQFRLAPDFIRRFKQAALDRDMKLNELLIYCFDEFMKTSKAG
jgi:hypothetical protein